MQLVVNGKEATISGNTLKELIHELKINSIGIAIAIDQIVIPKNQWMEYRLDDKMNVTIIKATQGG